MRRVLVGDLPVDQHPGTYLEREHDGARALTSPYLLKALELSPCMYVKRPWGEQNGGFCAAMPSSADAQAHRTTHLLPLLTLEVQ